MVRTPRADIMQPRSTASDSATQRHRPKTLTVFAAAFAAGAVLAYGVDRVVDVHVVQVEPQVESEPIFVALRSLPQGAPITVWDVALKDWPKAMLPTTALKADASFEGMVLRHPIREGQPLLSVQLVRDGATLPTTAVATLPPGTAPTAARSLAPAAAPQPAAVTAPPMVPVEQFVPAMPAEPSSATAVVEPAARAAEVSRVEAGPAAVNPVATPAAAAEVTAVADADIDADITADVTAAESTTQDAADGPQDGSAEPAPRAVATAETRPADAVTNAPADGPALGVIGRLFAAGTGAAPAAEPTLAVAEPATPAEVAPLAAPVPNLPTTDIEQSLSAFSRRGSPPDAPTESVLDRTATEPPPARSTSTPRYHLVVPERIALAADSSFAQRPEPPSTPTTPPPVTAPRQQAATVDSNSSPRRPGTTAATNRNVRPQGQGSPPAMRPSQATTRQQAAKPAAARQAAAKPGASKQAAASRGSRPAAKSAATPTPDKAATPAGRGLGAWFPQFSGGSWQR